MDQNIRQPDRCPFSAFFLFLFSCFFYGPAKEAGIETINRMAPSIFFEIDGCKKETGKPRS